MARLGSWFALALVVVAVWLYPEQIRAAEGPRYAGIERPRIAEPGARLLVEDVDLECVDVEPRSVPVEMTCVGTFRWVVELPVGAKDTELTFFAEAAKIEGIEVDGVDVELETVPAELYDRWWPKPWLAPEGAPLLRSQTRALLRGAGTHTIEVRASLHPRDLWVNHRDLHLSTVRHVIVTKPHEGLRLFFASSTDIPAEPPELPAAEDRSIRVKVPRKWRVNRRQWTVERSGKHRVLHSKDAVAPTSLYLSKGEPFPGGPLAAAGVSIQHRGDVRPRLRLGYELGSLPFLVHTLAVETDLRRVVLVASTDIGTQNIFVFFPSFSAGVGVPLRVYPAVRPGVRAQGALGWPFVSLLGTFDVFPPLGSGDLELIGGAMLQLNL